MWCTDLQINLFFSCISSQWPFKWNNKDDLTSHVDTPLSDIPQSAVSIIVTSFPVRYSEPLFVHSFIGAFIASSLNIYMIYLSIHPSIWPQVTCYWTFSWLQHQNRILYVFVEKVLYCFPDWHQVWWHTHSSCCPQWLSSVQRRVRPVVQHQCPSGGCYALHYSWAIWIHANTLAQRQVPMATTGDPAPSQHQHQSASVQRVCESQHQGHKHSNHWHETMIKYSTNA